MTGTTRPIAFHHVSSVVADLDRSVAFYSGLLGLEVRSRTRCEMDRLRVAGTDVGWAGSGTDWSTEPGGRGAPRTRRHPHRTRATLNLPVRVRQAPAGNHARGAPGRQCARVAAGVGGCGVRSSPLSWSSPKRATGRGSGAGAKTLTGYEVELVEEMPTSYQLERMAERLREVRAQRGMT